MSSSVIINPNKANNNPRIDFSGNAITGFMDLSASVYELGTQTGDIRLLTAGTDRLHILNNGNVGIGNQNPQYRLDVSGGIFNVSNNSASSLAIGFFLNPYIAANVTSRIAIGTAYTTSQTLSVGFNSGVGGPGNTVGVNSSWGFMGLTNATTQFTFTSNNYYIGTGQIPPNAGTTNILQVDGNVYVNGGLSLPAGDVQTQFTNLRNCMFANFILTGGGNITFDSAYNLSWTSRIIAIPVPVTYGTDCHFSMNMPLTGNTITYYSSTGVTTKTWTASGIAMSLWQALYYKLPVGAGQATVNANYFITDYIPSVAPTIDNTCVLIADFNGDSSTLYFRPQSRIIPLNSTFYSGSQTCTWIQNTITSSTSISCGTLSVNSNNITLGSSAGSSNQGQYGIAIGYAAGNVNQGTNAVAIGNAAGTTTQGSNAVAVGYLAGEFSQSQNSVAVGNSSGYRNQGQNAVAIGNTSGYTSQYAGAVAVGYASGYTNQGSQSVALGYAPGYLFQGINSIGIGSFAATNTQGDYGIAIGFCAGYQNQKTSTVAIGYQAGYNSQYPYTVAIGLNAGYTNQGTYAIGIGNSSGYTNQGQFAVAIGVQTANYSQGQYAVGLGYQCGFTNQGQYALAIGVASGYYNQSYYGTAIGNYAGYSAQGTYSIAIGQNAGIYNQASYAVAIGYNPGYSNQGAAAIAIGSSCGQTFQGANGIAIGNNAASGTQGAYAIAVGYQAGLYNQGSPAVAIGQNTGLQNQGANAIAIGQNAGNSNQGQNAIAIGQAAGQTSQPANSIVINASGNGLNGIAVSSTCISPLRSGTSLTGSGSVYVMLYNSSTYEVGYSSVATVTTKTFVIPHPTTPTKYLVHACLEGPESGVYYRGKGEVTDNQQTTVYLPDYVDALATEFTVQITAIYNGSQIQVYNASEVANNQFTVYGPTGKFYWLVQGKRGDIEVEPDVYTTKVHGNGPYRWI